MIIELGIVIAALGLVISYQAFQLNKTKFIKDESQESKESLKAETEVKTELGYIRKGVDDIRIDLKANEKQMISLGERITRVEESSKQAHKRLDTLENKGEM